MSFQTMIGSGATRTVDNCESDIISIKNGALGMKFPN